MVLAKKAEAYDQDLMRDMKAAQIRHGASLTKQVFDYLALRNAGTALSFEEYHFFELYNRPRAAYETFMGAHRARAAYFLANSLDDWDQAEDKLNFAQTIAAARLPAPKLVAFAHPSRDTHDVKALRSTDDIRAFLASCVLPVFGKPAMASHGDGAVQIKQRDGETLFDEAGQAFSVEDFLAGVKEYVDGAGYLFQEALEPQAGIATLTGGRIASMRLVVMLGRDGPQIRYGVIRLPAGENRVDNFRRKGNLIAPIDCATGKLGPARRGIGVSAETLTVHPDTQQLIDGAQLAGFEQAKAVVRDASALFPSLHLQSWDVAMTITGPSLLEVNPGGNFNILQHALGRGVFDADFRKFLEQRLNDNPNAAARPKALKEARKLLKL